MNGTSSPLPAIGDQAPDFTLPSTGGGDVTLSSFCDESHVVLAFFPLAFTGVCTAEMCDFSQDFVQFRGANATVLGISVDSIPTLNEFKTKHAISIDLLSDFKREVCRRYGVLSEEDFVARRAYVIVGGDGTVKWVHVEEHPGLRRDNQELLGQLAQLG